MKLAAFTLIEVVIALAVLSIVTVLTYNGFAYLAGGTRTFVQDSQQHLELMGFAARLEADIAHAERVEAPEDQQLRMLHYNNAEVLYQLRDGYLFRLTETTADSIPAFAMNWEPLAQNDPKASALIKGVEVEADLFGSPQHLYFFKQYHPAQLLERP
ncbi:PulJ/GspJ family protein [Gilvibacter sp.]|uniref:PulJ/GspJ family protein n=1 Tax=Gilvibacter sp. TaxID=2729997 RepID=UPI003F4A05FA